MLPTYPTKNELLELLPYLTVQERGQLDELLRPADEFYDSDPVRWIESNVIIPETGTYLHLEPYQKKALALALELDGNGLFRNSIIVWSDVKKSAKSTIAAAVALWRAFQVDWGQIVIVANDLKQADSRVGYYMRRAIELNPRLKSICQIRNYLITLPNHTRIESVPIDPSGEAGGNADMVVFSELWGAHQEGAKRMWTEMTLPPGKFGRSFRWVETYAGFSGESLLLEQLYQQGVEQSQRLDSDLEIFRNDTARMFCMWNTHGRMPWHSPEYYSQEQSILLPSEFERVHHNKWATSQDVFVPLESFDRCKIEPVTYPKDWPMVVALDAAVSGDTFGMVGVSRMLADPLQSVCRFDRCWKPPKGGKIDYQGTVEDPGPELVLRRLLKENNIVEVAYDPYQLEDMANRLSKEGLGWFRAFSQGGERLVADSQLRQMILDNRFHHTGSVALREHVGNANAQVDPEAHKIRIVKRSELLKIDLCVAASMANHECLRLNL